MSKIYRKVILGHKTNFFRCESCLNEDNEPQMVWESRYVEVVGPGEGNPGVWEEAPLEKCDMCYAVDLQSQEEMQDWCNDMDQQSWEEDQMDPSHNPQELK